MGFQEDPLMVGRWGKVGRGWKLSPVKINRHGPQRCSWLQSPYMVFSIICPHVGKLGPNQANPWTATQSLLTKCLCG